MDDAVNQYLSSHDLLFLATSSRDGNVHVAPMFYAAGEDCIYFSAADGTETANNLKQNPTAAIAVADPVDDWSKCKGLQIEGPVDELDGPEETHAGELFLAKFPHLGDAAMHTHYWKLNAAEIRFTDNDKTGNEHVETLGTTWSRTTTSG